MDNGERAQSPIALIANAIAMEMTTTPTTILEDCDVPPSVRSTQPLGCDEGVIDQATFETIEADRLFDTLNHATTTIGQAVLYRSLVRPSDSLQAINEKQEALAELASDADYRKQIESLVANAKERETNFYNLLFGTFTGFFGSSTEGLKIDEYGYTTYNKGTRFMLDMVRDADTLPQVKSRYLNETVNSIRGFANSRAYRLMRGPVYATERALLTSDEKRWYIPTFKFRQQVIKPFLLLSVLALIVIAFKFVVPFFGVSERILPLIGLFSFPLMIFYFPIIGDFDRNTFIYPLRDLYKGAKEVQQTLDALGALDELLALHRFGQDFGNDMVMPNLAPANCHRLELQGACNPILGYNNPDFVRNDIEFKEQTLTFITGPNSGGKTTVCKTMAQIQLLAQIGSYIPAQKAILSVADRIFFQIPKANALQDDEGRFGTELKRTKEIFFATSPRSLVILDELSEGTTYEEKLETSYDVLSGFKRIGNNTVLITHNHELVDKFKEQGTGAYWQVEFQDNAPTYKLVGGISRVSHADKIMHRIGFAKEHIENSLSERGYLENND